MNPCHACGAPGQGLRCQSCGERRQQAPSPNTSPPKPVPEHVQALAAALDGGEGWLHETNDTCSWFPHRLRVTLRQRTVRAVDLVEAVVPILHEVEFTPEVADTLNRVNRLATGWRLVWLPDDRQVVASAHWDVARWSLEQQVWSTARMATAAEHLAERLRTALGGSLALQPHPVRGIRQEPDGWFEGVAAAASREGCSVLSTVLTDAESSKLAEELRPLFGATGAERTGTTEVRWVDNAGNTRALLKNEWHPDFGFGLRLFVPLCRSSTPLDAALLHNQALSSSPATAAGVVIAEGDVVGFSLTLSAVEVEQLATSSLVHAFATLVEVIGNLERKPVDGPVTIAPLKPDPRWGLGAPAAVALAAGSAADAWSAPREAPLATFGVYDDHAPSVVSLHVAHGATGPALVACVHRPTGSSVSVLETGPRDQLVDGAGAHIERLLDLAGRLPHWLQAAPSLHGAVVAAIEARMVTEIPGAAARTASHVGDPRALRDAEVLAFAERFGAEPAPVTSSDVARWVTAVSATDHVVGCTQRLREVWEPAKYRAAGDEAAASHTQRLITAVNDRRLRGQPMAVEAGANDEYAAVTWREVLDEGLGFIADDADWVVHGDQRLDWYARGLRVTIASEMDDTDDGHRLCLVNVTTTIATAPETVGAAVAEMANRRLPMSSVVFEGGRLDLRFSISLSSRGRTLLRFLTGAVLLQVEHAEQLREAMSNLAPQGVRPVVVDHPQRGAGPAGAGPAFADVFPDDGSWFPARWPSVRAHLVKYMRNMGYPTGWGNDEVQYFNELTPDLAVASLNPPDSRFSHYGAGVTVIARVVPPHEGLAELHPTTVNDINRWVMSCYTSAFGGFTSEHAAQVGLQASLWVPVALIGEESWDDESIALFLLNVVVHASRAPFSWVAAARSQAQ